MGFLIAIFYNNIAYLDYSIHPILTLTKNEPAGFCRLIKAIPISTFPIEIA